MEADRLGSYLNYLTGCETLDCPIMSNPTNSDSSLASLKPLFTQDFGPSQMGQGLLSPSAGGSMPCHSWCARWSTKSRCGAAERSGTLCQRWFLGITNKLLLTESQLVGAEFQIHIMIYYDYYVLSYIFVQDQT